MQIHITHVRAGRSSSHFTFSIAAVAFPFSPCLPTKGSSLAPRIIRAQEECALPNQSLVRCWMSPSCVPHVAEAQAVCSNQD